MHFIKVLKYACGMNTTIRLSSTIVQLNLLLILSLAIAHIEFFFILYCSYSYVGPTHQVVVYSTPQLLLPVVLASTCCCSIVVVVVPRARPHPSRKTNTGLEDSTDWSYLSFHKNYICDKTTERNKDNSTRKMVPITGRASSFIVFLEFSKTK